MNVIEYEQKTRDKSKMLSGDPVDSLAKFVSVRPVGSKNKEILKQDMDLFHQVVGKLQEKDYDTLMKTLKEEDAEALIDYLHRYMQYVGESENQIVSSGSMLRLYERIIKEYGPTIIAKANFRPDTLVNRIQNY